jgi:acyl-CoA thioester hydrolase
VSYRELEDGGLLLAVADLRLRFRRPARYDDLVRIRCWVRALESRKVTFGYAVEAEERGALLATAETSLVALNRKFAVIRLPQELRQRLAPCPDPIRL